MAELRAKEKRSQRQARVRDSKEQVGSLANTKRSWARDAARDRESLGKVEDEIVRGGGSL